MKEVEKYRVNRDIPVGKAYILQHPSTRERLGIIASIDDGWEHVSVSLPHRTPTWNEMRYVKKVFFEDEDLCVQFHPKKSQYVNHHPYCLHIWKPPQHILSILEKEDFL
jgi:hypothetical protein